MVLDNQEQGSDWEAGSDKSHHSAVSAEDLIKSEVRPTIHARAGGPRFELNGVVGVLTPQRAGLLWVLGPSRVDAHPGAQN